MVAAEYRNILIIKLKHLGDTLTTTPVIGGIRKAWPEARISYLVNPGSQPLVFYDPAVAEVLAVPREGGMMLHLRFIRELRRRRFDLVLELSGGDRGAFLAWVSGAGTRVGYRPKRSRPLDRRMFLNRQVTSVVESKHTVEYHLDALRVLGAEPGFQPMRLFWPNEAGERVRDLLRAGGLDDGRAYAVVHPSSRWMFKAWRPEGNAEVADFLFEKLGLPVVLTAAPEPKELDFVRRVRAAMKTEPLDLSGRLALPELGAVIAGARVFFGVDSLPMHMAAAVGTPSVVLFGPSGEHMWGPWGEGHQVLTKDFDCRPCGRDGCQGTKISRCLTEIGADEVYPLLERAVGRE